MRTERTGYQTSLLKWVANRERVVVLFQTSGVNEEEDSSESDDDENNDKTFEMILSLANFLREYSTILT